MTAQCSEKLSYLGFDLPMATCPLSDYFRLVRTPVDIEFARNSTALHRGYIGHWKIIDHRLYLSSLHGELNSGEPLRLEMIFPGFPDLVFAHWYTGTLRIPRGRMLEYKHSGFGSLYAYDLMILIDEGRVKRLCVISNETQEVSSDEKSIEEALHRDTRR
ncbi:hypothetical protein [Rheinheimera sp. MM224]|uniref:hypothetical protein n=1 Tax=Rheinheimera sp. MM224 TaxID=3019969 RepID=UPI0021F85BCE|nr:hypothetical protein [Rheinheimera sp. MM224]CAI3798112.1 hypothetical protein JAMGFMIE_01990 [Rheinheimera sp. MM224]